MDPRFRGIDNGCGGATVRCEQDGEFLAVGGREMAMSTALINSLLSSMSDQGRTWTNQFYFCFTRIYLTRE